jgi:hypothetical protein
MDTKEMVAQLDSLIGRYRELVKSIDLEDGSTPSFGIIANRLEAAIDRIASPTSSYLFQLNKYRNDPSSARARRIYQVAVALRDDIKEGWTKKWVDEVHAETYSDYLEMADGLLTSGYKDAAAVITGTSLEVHLRALCVKNGVTTAVAGKPKRANALNADLKKAGVYDGLGQQKVTTWLALRNKAAHGDYVDYDQDEVRQFINGVQAFLAKYPA